MREKKGRKSRKDESGRKYWKKRSVMGEKEEKEYTRKKLAENNEVIEADHYSHPLYPSSTTRVT